MPTVKPTLAAAPPSAPPAPPLIGHTALRARLAGAAARGTLPGSLLLHGPRGVGKQRLALSLAQVLLCSAAGTRPCGVCESCRYAAQLSHPDLHWFFPRPRLKDADPSPSDVVQDYADAIAERVAAGLLYGPPSGTDAIYVATVRALAHIAVMTPAMAQRKVIIIGDAERMVPQEGAEAAANAVLKLLEEPPEDTTIILTSSEPGALLPTIRSRVVAVRVAPLGDAEVRAFVRHATVRKGLDAAEAPVGEAERVQLAHGAPGLLLAIGTATARAAAAALLRAGRSAQRSDRYRAALIQGAAGARGTFSETLDALTSILRQQLADAVERDEPRRARAAIDAITSVEAAKERADWNVNPQLIATAVLRSLAPLRAAAPAASTA